MKNCLKFYELCLPRSTPEETSEFVALCEKISQMVTDKLSTDVPGFIKDDVLLSHVIDEVIIFSKEVDEIEMISTALPRESLPISVMAYDKIFSR